MDPGRRANGHQTTVNDGHITGFCRGPRKVKQLRKNCIWGMRAGIRARPLVYGPSIIAHPPRVVKYKFLFIKMYKYQLCFCTKKESLFCDSLQFCYAQYSAAILSISARSKNVFINLSFFKKLFGYFLIYSALIRLSNPSAGVSPQS